MSENQNSPSKTKQYYREKVWDCLENNDLMAAFPRPAHGKIPNFKQADLAARKLLELDCYKSAKSMEINPDKPLASCRILALEDGKILYVPVPKLQEGFLKKLSKTVGHSSSEIISKYGMETLGKPVSFSDKIQLDLVIMGSVAVSKKGRRIGKGKGYADLEFAILKEMGAVSDDTPLATIVHDAQVFDDLPDSLFDLHDVPVDYIVTPTQIIVIEEKLQRPSGIFWDLLTEEQVESMPILGILREHHSKQRRDVGLKVKPRERKLSGKNRRDSNQTSFTLEVSNIEKNVRVSSLKEALTQNGIRPNYITWRGHEGFCYLHYAGHFTVDNIVKTIQNLEINSQATNLEVKVLDPITGIETLGVTAV